MKRKMGKKGATVGVAALAVLALLFGTGKLGFGTGDRLGDNSDATGETASVVDTVTDTQENTAATNDEQGDIIEIRVQGREYNYQNVSYGSSEHPLEELLDALKQLPTDTKIELVVEDNATKNAVDELEAALTAAGFTNIRK